MGISAPAADERVKNVEFTDDVLSVALMDGRTISVPLVWYPRLLDASETERQNWQISGSGYGIHWPDIDEDLSTEGLLRGAPAPRQSLYARRGAVRFTEIEDFGAGVGSAVEAVGAGAGSAVESKGEIGEEEVRCEEVEIDGKTEPKGRRSTLMSKRKRGVHVTPRGDKWAVVREGSERASSLHDTQQQAVKKGRETARRNRTEFYLHNQQGQIRERDSYGPESRSSKG